MHRARTDSCLLSFRGMRTPFSGGSVTEPGAFRPKAPVHLCHKLKMTVGLRDHRQSCKSVIQTVTESDGFLFPEFSPCFVVIISIFCYKYRMFSVLFLNSFTANESIILVNVNSSTFIRFKNTICLLFQTIEVCIFKKIEDELS